MDHPQAEHHGETGEQPHETLTKGQLTLILAVVTLVPFLLVVILYFATPDHRDPELKVEVQVGPRAWPSDSSPDARLVPCIILRNPTEETWRNVNVAINEQYFYYHPGTIEPGQEVVIPLKFFHTKGSTVYHPEDWPMTHLTVYAQLPSGARAIKQWEGDELLPLISSLNPSGELIPPAARH
ncbi:MAG: hypothetical protein KatS3mg111_1624 [Pirellulaceae bacterium]|nr:MAG: hypothetical protein KatS3mg111_1624 [Pirellulaceae bacterium]